MAGVAILGWKIWKNNIWMCDLASQDIAEISDLYMNGKRQVLARYPNLDPSNPVGSGRAYVAGDVVPMHESASDSKNAFGPDRAIGGAGLGRRMPEYSSFPDSTGGTTFWMSGKLIEPDILLRPAKRRATPSDRGTAITSKVPSKNSMLRGNGPTTEGKSVYTSYRRNRWPTQTCRISWWMPLWNSAC